MRTSKYKISKLAQVHLLKIKNYTLSEFSQAQWDSYKNKLLTGFEMLADNPSVGITCNELFQSGFYFPIGKHTVYFTKENSFILVVAVLNQSQLPQKHLR